jgi:hypothetical protein
VKKLPSIAGFLDGADSFFLEAREELKRKTTDYGDEGKALAGIFDIAEDMQLRPSFVAFILMHKHWSAIKTWAKHTHLDSESINSRLIDLANFCAILSIVVELEGYPLRTVETSDARAARDEPEDHLFVGKSNMCDYCHLALASDCHIRAARKEERDAEE